MKRRSFTKQTRTDFLRRVDRVNPNYNRRDLGLFRPCLAPARPLISSLIGFGWFYAVMSVAANRPVIEHSLLEGSLPSQFHAWVIAALAALLAISAVMLLKHLLRFLLRRGAARSNSGGIVFGALVAGTLIHTPPAVLDSGAQMLDRNSRALFQLAEARVGKDLTDFVFVSSMGR